MVNNDAKFLHFRHATKRASVSGEVTEINARGGVTIAYTETAQGIEYAAAKCHTKDNFVKHQGRVKAAGRLSSGKYRRVFDGSEREFVDFITLGMAANGLTRKYSGNRKRKLTAE